MGADPAGRRIDDFLARCGRAERSPAVVLGSSVNGLSFVRSLGRRGVPTLLLDHRRQVGAYSRFATTLVLPPPAGRPGAWLEALESIGRRLPRPAALFSTSDPYTLLIAENETELRPRFRFLVPSRRTLRRITNKRTQYAFARRADVPIPPSHFPETTDEAAETASVVSYPCILKPYRSHVARGAMRGKVALVDSPDALLRAYRRLARAGVETMVQEIVPGPDRALYGYLAFWDAHGSERHWLTKRKLRQEDRFGNGSFQATVEAPRVAELSRRLLRRLGYRGFVGVEFKLDARTDTFRLMEINARTVSGNELAIAAGVDFPWIGYRYLTGAGAGAGAAANGIGVGPGAKAAAGSVGGTDADGDADGDGDGPRAEDGGGFEVGVRYVNEEWDLLAYRRLRGSDGLTFAGWLRSVRGARARAIGARDDPVPLLVTAARQVKAVVRAALSGMRRLRGRSA